MQRDLEDSDVSSGARGMTDASAARFALAERRLRAVQMMRIAAKLALAAPVASLALTLGLYLVAKSHDGQSLRPLAVVGTFTVVSIVAFYIFAIEANRRARGGRRIRSSVVVALLLYPLSFFTAAIPIAKVCFLTGEVSGAVDAEKSVMLGVGIGLTFISVILGGVFAMTLFALMAGARSSR